MELFVPGRICLFGEHSDWAGGHRRQNSSIEKGYTIITGTNQGVYARVTPHPTAWMPACAGMTVGWLFSSISGEASFMTTDVTKDSHGRGAETQRNACEKTSMAED